MSGRIEPGRDSLAFVLREAADAMGAARRAMEMALRHVAGTTPMVDSGSEFGPVADECDRVRGVLREALTRLEGGG